MADDEDDDAIPDLFGLLEQLGGEQLIGQIRQALAGSSGPVNWELARRGALQLAAEDDRAPTDEERARAAEAQQLAEHWLDEGSLPAPPDAGRLVVAGRQEWVNAAIEGLAPLIEPVAAASVAALRDFLMGQVGEQFGGQLGDAGLPFDLGGLGAILDPMGGVLMGMQAGQVIGLLSRQLLGQYDLGIPTADAGVAYRIAVNVADTFEGYELDDTEVAVTLALYESAHRRQYHAVPWLAGHVRDLVATFAAGTTLDPQQLEDVAREVMEGVDPDDPEAMRSAMERAGSFRLEPTAEQRRVLERIQGVVCLLQGWARWEVRAAAADRMADLGRVEEVLRRRRATRGEGEQQLANLLGLDLKPADETLGDRFVEAVKDARGPEGLRRALAHPENLPDTGELADPGSWLARMAGGEAVPDDPSALFGDEDAPIEPPGDQRGGPDEPA